MGRKCKTPANQTRLARENEYDDNESLTDDAEVLKPITANSENAIRKRDFPNFSYTLD